MIALNIDKLIDCEVDIEGEGLLGSGDIESGEGDWESFKGLCGGVGGGSWGGVKGMFGGLGGGSRDGDEGL